MKLPDQPLPIPPRRLKVGLLVSSISRLGGGVAEAVIQLALATRSLGLEPVIFAASDPFVDEAKEKLAGIEVVTRTPFGPESFRFMPNLLADVLARRLDLLHLHGIWQYPSIVGSRWRTKTGRPYVVSPHGMLEKWILDRGRTKKALASLVYERRNLLDASLVHVLSDTEAADVVRYVPGGRVAVLPNAIGSLHRAPAGAQRKPYILYLGRLHPKKNIERCIEAWVQLYDAGLTRGHRFLIAGWGAEDYVDHIRRSVAEQADRAVDFVGPVFGEAKDRLLSEARWLVLASFSEGVPMAILEGWSAGAPAIISTYCNLKEGVVGGAALECGVETPTIASAMARALNLSEQEWQTMSGACQNVIEQHFSPERIAASWCDLYSGLAASATDRQGLSNPLGRQ